MADDATAKAQALSRQAYYMKVMSQASPQDRANWYSTTGQFDAAKAWSNVSKFQTAGNLVLGALQIHMAHAIESQPGVAPPPPPKIAPPTAASVQARTEELSASRLAQIDAEQKRREAQAAVQEGRTSVDAQEAMHRGMQRARQAEAESARGAAIQEAGQQRGLIAQLDAQYAQQKYVYDKEEKARKRVADMNRLTGWGMLAGKAVSSLPSLIGMMAGINSAEAKAMGTTVDGLKAMRAASAAYEKENKILMQMEQARKDGTFTGDVQRRLQNEYAKARAKRDALGERATDLGVTSLPWVEVEARLAADRAAAAKKLGPVVLTQPATTTTAPTSASAKAISLEDEPLVAAMDERKANKEVAESVGVLGALNQDPSLASTLGAPLAPTNSEGLQASKGTQIGAGGLGARGSGLGGGGSAGGLTTMGTKGRGSGDEGYGLSSGDFGTKAVSSGDFGTKAGGPWVSDGNTIDLGGGLWTDTAGNQINVAPGNVVPVGLTKVY